MSSNKKKDDPKLSDFENLLEKLEKIVENLESEEMSLEESINSFEGGVEIYKDCKKLLDGAEKKINVLTDKLKEETF